MSRLGKKPIIIPSGVEVKINGDILIVKGPKGELSRILKNDIEISLVGNEITLKPKRNSKDVMALWGTYASHIKNMMEGVTKGFEKKLVIEGIGFKAQLEGTNLSLNLGFSHPVKVEIPKDLKATVEKNVISISGADKEKVGALSAKIRALKKPEPYKGKGIRYDNEVIRRKSGKKAATAAA
ncbi:MAG: 50S ribosomal protein L6 [Candidatus Paceibacterota bacterium]